MENSLFQNVYNPDVLSCIANLSNDEVFTPPELANKIIDMLPQELFENPDTAFLDPCCKSGVFLREIAKRLIKGLEQQIPDLEKRIEHIFSKQLFGIAITELTSLLSRRSVYCSKYPSGEFSVYQFPEEKSQGNIIFQRIKHTWKDGKCTYCGASQNEYDRGAELENHAYQFIHNLDVNKVFNMKFDVIIGNPPYQMSDGGGTLDEFRDEMLHDEHIREIHDFGNANDCFPGVAIEGGVCYFLWDRDQKGLCKVYSHSQNQITAISERPLLEKGADVFIRYNEVISIIRKVASFNEESFSQLVSPRNPYYFRSPFVESKKTINTCKVFGVEGGKRQYKNIDKSFIGRNKDELDKYKIFISKADGAAGQIGYPVPARILGKSEIAGKNTACTETFLRIGPFGSEQECKNVKSYIETKFFRCLVGARKNKNMTQSTVPIQDFSKSWTDKELYEKYNLTQNEIDFIESMITSME